MECREVIENMDEYIEKRLTDIEAHNIKKHIDKCQPCKKEYIEMKNVFDIISDCSNIQAPLNFTDRVMNNIKSYETSKKIKQLALSRWGTSLVAAGILLMILNFTQYSPSKIMESMYESATEINKIVVNPFSKISDKFKIISNLNIWNK
ncbi:hypothetical protein CLPU_16c00560 [Gottschalkia purinilytica]|uniref:Putative zinc-finger domain-containing protein n=1 Tax=Gottschalkia purinilytica TaxID=1503 RepID=A0A0L0W8A9_GOTPU|nr:zf-HC2 domain-containing protein [Gottschalkia purinilytica]KNF07500.1 hypothetical protein CLPU_16c00560 [Gottschalkia purinilytica]